MSYYLIILLLSVSIPIALSFERKVAFYKSIPSLLIAIIPVAIVFTLWDIYYTSKGIWHFNPDHVYSGEWVGLPVEEILFFAIIPYACLFIHEVQKAYNLPYFSKRVHIWFSGFLMAFFLLTGILYLDKMYTSSVSFGAFLSLFVFILLKANYIRRFYTTFALCLIPFFLVNGALTGMFSHEPVVYYNALENTGYRIITIPAEDFIYAFILVLLNVYLFEWIKARQQKRFT